MDGGRDGNRKDARRGWPAKQSHGLTDFSLTWTTWSAEGDDMFAVLCGGW